MLVAHADEPPPLTVARLLAGWQLDLPVLAGVLLLAGSYVVGVARLTRRGDAWPVARSVSFLGGGVGTIAIATLSGLAAYDDTLFSVHMVQHMLLAMVAPVFLALGAPLTLALRALPTGSRRWLLALLHNPVSKMIAFPLVGAFLFVLTPFALYFSPIYEATLRSELLHALLHVHFLATGCLFLWPVLGLDPLPHRPAYPLRLVLLFVTLPFHAFLGVAIMSNTEVLAGDWYAGVQRSWGPPPLDDQHLGGGLLWASGDLIGVLLIGTVFTQWMRADERAARREDRQLDRSTAEDNALVAYNQRLAALARRAERTR